MGQGQSAVRRQVLEAVGLGLVSYAGARIALRFQIEPEGMATFWFVNGVVLAVLVRRPVRQWYLLLGATFAGFATNALVAGYPAYPDLVYGVTNVVEPLLAAIAIRHFAPRFDIGSLRALRVLILSAVAACMVSATIATLVGPIRWWLWFTDDLLGMLLVAPAILAFWPPGGRVSGRGLPPAGRMLEMSLIATGLTVTAAIVFLRVEGSLAHHLFYATLPFLLWSALRFKERGAVLSCLLLATLTVGFTINGHGPFVAGLSRVADRSLSIQAVMAVLLLSHVALGVALTERERIATLNRIQIASLARIAAGEPLQASLDRIVCQVEAHGSDLIASLLLVDPREGRLLLGSAPHLPEEYNRAIHGGRIAPDAGSCGAAASRGERVLVADIATHPNWADYRQLALPHGLRACWSTPILSPTHEVLGTFAIYYREIRLPSAEEVRWVDAATHLASIAILRDRSVTERKDLEAQVVQAQRMESLGTLAGGIAHDFNNILTAIVGNVELARQALPAGHDVQPRLATVEEASARATDLIKQILTFSRGRKTERALIDLRPVVAEALSLLGAALPAMIKVRTAFAEQEIRVLADPSQIHQVVMNLGTNAAHAMEGGGGQLDVRIEHVTLSASLEGATSTLEPGPHARLTVEDSGCGMDAATLSRIFEPFFTTKAVGQGTGLGLSVVLGIVKGHGGAVTVTSRHGQGTTFAVYLPLAHAAEAAEAAVRVDARAMRGRGEGILFLDDEESIVALVVTTLDGLGYRTVGLSDPRGALDRIATSPGAFQAIVTDYAMPGMSGLDFVRAARKLCPSVPVVLVSGHLTEDVRAAARALGVRETVGKPDVLKTLPAVLRQVLQ